MICEYCNTTFKTLSSLNYHKKSAKYCLQLRNEEIKINKIFVCDFCKKIVRQNKKKIYMKKNVKIFFQIMKI